MQEKRTLTGTHGTHATMHFTDQGSLDRDLQRRKSTEYTIQLRGNYSGDKTDHSNFYDGVENRVELLTTQGNEGPYLGGWRHNAAPQPIGSRKLRFD